MPIWWLILALVAGLGAVVESFLTPGLQAASSFAGGALAGVALVELWERWR